MTAQWSVRRAKYKHWLVPNVTRKSTRCTGLGTLIVLFFLITLRTGEKRPPCIERSCIEAILSNTKPKSEVTEGSGGMQLAPLVCGSGACEFFSRSVEGAVNHSSQATWMQPYQKAGANAILDSLGRDICSAPSRVLEYGCDVTGAQSLLFVEECSRAQYVGVNCKHNTDFPENTVRVNHIRVDFLELAPCSATLPFANSSFHAVFSDNVLEHVSRDSLVNYISETYRVLRMGGASLFQAHATWGSARGHHIHEDMVQWWAQQLNCSHRQQYKNDGSIIPDFSHIHLSAEQFTRMLEKTSLAKCSGLVSRVVDFVFHEEDISRVMVGEMIKIVREFDWSSVSVTNEGEGAFIRIHAIK